MTSFVDARGLRFAYDRSGEGPDLTLIHAGVTDRHMWDDVVPLLTDAYTVLRYDMRGFGETTEADPGPWGAHDDLIGILDALDIETTAVVGVSMGGGAAINAALEFPDRFSALVAVNPGLGGFDYSPDRWEEELWDRISDSFKEGRHDDCARMEMEMWLAGPHRTVEDMDPALVERMRAWLHTAYGKEPTTENVPVEPAASGRLGEIGIPTLAVLGELDVAGMKPVIDHIVESVAGATRASMPGVAHLPPLEEPEGFSEILLEFLGGG
jgi:pimeloyl-ACP methyl ester carboxylesterase